MTVRDAVVKGGQLVLEAPLSLPDGTRVKVRLESADTDPLLFLAEHAVDTEITDRAEQHDHYVYGTQKRHK
jgi:hypothetical protein